ncbi:alpha/beta hydrolase [Rosenbergiella collisarenosi]|uniref:alpha/beta hydrolase n=1 Tax=Rosenbergiella collisarenosi TaxID=1544695 RepID=UPI001F4E58D5|nr:alpha/beta hydrolase [Rosenbergiella collisarenosi]
MMSTRLLLLLFCLPLSVRAMETTIALWPSNSAQVRPGPAAVVSKKGAIIQVNAPFLSFYPPDHFNGKTVLIAAGGGYRRIQQAKEALPAAQFLARHGFRAYVLTYRLPSNAWPEGKDAAIADVRQALKKLKPTNPQLSVLGFSAGAHLLALAINRPDYRVIQHTDEPRIEGMALIYPIVTLEAPYTHSRTHQMLVGHHATPSEEKQWSVQTVINDDSPPLFVVEADDDPIAPPIHGQRLNAAATSHHIPMQWFRYPSGGHGFGLGKAGTPVSEWPQRYLVWLNRLADQS